MVYCPVAGSTAKTSMMMPQHINFRSTLLSPSHTCCAAKQMSVGKPHLNSKLERLRCPVMLRQLAHLKSRTFQVCSNVKHDLVAETIGSSPTAGTEQGREQSRAFLITPAQSTENVGLLSQQTHK